MREESGGPDKEKGQMMMQPTKDEILTAVVVQSLQQQEEMLGLLGTLQQQFTTDSNSQANVIENFNLLFSTLQVKMEEADLQVIEQLGKSDIPDTTRQLLGRRKNMQEHIVRLLKETVPKVRSVKSLLASEIESLKIGRRALNGYKNMSARQGAIINGKQ